MYTQILTGVGAGLASALLFAVVISGSPAAILLSYLSPLPIFIVTIGWRHRTGLIAVATGILASMIAFRFSSGLVYGLGLALPAWWLGYIVMLGRTDPDGHSEWYPIGKLLFWISGIAALVTVLGAISMGGSYEAYEQTMRNAINSLLTAGGSAGGDAMLPPGFSKDEFASTIVAAAPLLTAASFVPMQVLNLWLAARIVAASGRLARPWPALSEARLPLAALGVMTIAVTLAIIGEGFIGFTGVALAGGLGAAYAMQCLGAIHTSLRGKSLRPLVLALVYALMIPFFVWILPALALGGVLDSIARALGTRTSPPPPANDA